MSHTLIERTPYNKFLDFFGLLYDPYSRIKKNNESHNEITIKRFVDKGKNKFGKNFGWAYKNVYKKQVKVKPEFVSSTHKDAYYLMFDYLFVSDNNLCVRRDEEKNTINDFNINNFVSLAINLALSPSLFMENSVLKFFLVSGFVVSLILFLVLFFFRFKECSEKSYTPYWTDHSEEERVGYFLAKYPFYNSKDPSGKAWSGYLYGLIPLDVARIAYEIPTYFKPVEEGDSAIVRHGKKIFGCKINESIVNYYSEIVKPEYVDSNHENAFKIMLNYLNVVDEKIKTIRRQIDYDNLVWNVCQSVLVVFALVNSISFFMISSPVKNVMLTLFFVSIAVLFRSLISRIAHNFYNNLYFYGDDKWNELRSIMLVEDCAFYRGVDPLGVPWVDYFANSKLKRRRIAGSEPMTQTMLDNAIRV